MQLLQRNHPGYAQRRPKSTHVAVARAQTRGMATAAAAGPSDVFVLDFDGVLVDSEPEVN